MPKCCWLERIGKRIKKLMYTAKIQTHLGGKTFLMKLGTLLRYGWIPRFESSGQITLIGEKNTLFGPEVSITVESFAYIVMPKGGNSNILAYMCEQKNMWKGVFFCSRMCMHILRLQVWKHWFSGKRDVFFLLYGKFRGSNLMWNSAKSLFKDFFLFLFFEKSQNFWYLYFHACVQQFSWWMPHPPGLSSCLFEPLKFFAVCTMVTCMSEAQESETPIRSPTSQFEPCK